MSKTALKLVLAAALLLGVWSIPSAATDYPLCPFFCCGRTATSTSQCRTSAGGVVTTCGTWWQSHACPLP